MYKCFGILFVCEWIGPGYTSINSEKNVFNPIMKLLQFLQIIHEWHSIIYSSSVAHD